MHLLLTKYLKKIGIKDIKNLSSEEKQTFEKWNQILSDDEEINVEKIEKFCQSQLDVIEIQWKNMDNQSLKNERLIIAHTIYSTLLKVIRSPKTKKVVLEDYLNKLLK